MCVYVIRQTSKKVSPAKLFKGFVFSKKNNKVLFKLDLENLDAVNEAVTHLEELLLELKSVCGLMSLWN